MKKAYGRCDKCGQFFYGVMNRGDFIPDEHPCVIEAKEAETPKHIVKKKPKRNRTKK